MFTTLKKAYWLLRYRPTQFASTLRQYWLFYRTRLLQAWVFPKGGHVRLGPNVRLQTLSALSAERPHSRISVGQNSVIYEHAQVESYGKGQIEVGANSILGDCRIYSREQIRIGERFITSWNVFIQDFDPHPLEPELRGRQLEEMCAQFRPRYGRTIDSSSTPFDWKFPTSPISIGDDVWLGANVTILKGVTIGNGCIVATGSVVTAGTYPDRSILAGVPAKVVKQLT